MRREPMTMSVQENLCHPFWTMELCVATLPLQALVVSSDKWESNTGCVVRSNEGTCLCTPSIRIHAVGKEMGRGVTLPHGQGREGRAISKASSGPSQAAEASWLALINDYYNINNKQNRDVLGSSVGGG